MKKFIACWKTAEGDKFIFLGKYHTFDSANDALNFQVGEFIWYVPFGIRSAGHLEIELDSEGNGQIPHAIGELGILGEVMIIEGPEFDKVFLTHDNAST